MDVNVGFGDLLTEAAGGQEALEERRFLITHVAAPGEDHGPCLHHAGQVGHDPQHFGPGREELGKDGDGRKGCQPWEVPKGDRTCRGAVTHQAGGEVRSTERELEVQPGGDKATAVCPAWAWVQMEEGEEERRGGERKEEEENEK